MAEPGEDSASTRDAVAAAPVPPRARGSAAIRAAIVIGVAAIAGLVAAEASAQPAPAEPAPTAPASTGESLLRGIEIHGFASEGAFVQTANDYFGSTSRASLELFEAGLNVSTEVTDRLRAGLQLFSRDVGSIRDASPRLDWAFLDYRWRSWLGLRAGIVKMPFGLYNEYIDIDAARLPLLLPSSVYPIRNRDVLLSHTGFAVHGNRAIGAWGDLEYQAWLGSLTIPRTALQLTNGATLDSVNSKYVTGAQLFWHPPLDGLRLGATFVRASIDYHVDVGPTIAGILMMAGAVPANYDRKLLIAQRPLTFLVGSAEYIHGDWLFAAEYSRWLTHQRSSLAVLSPTFDRDSEKFYGLATYRLSRAFEVGGYYSVFNMDVDDMPPKYAEPYYAFQRDLAATLRFDVNDHWLWKLEGHFMDGAASLPTEFNTHADRYWGMFLLRTTVTF